MRTQSNSPNFARGNTTKQGAMPKSFPKEDLPKSGGSNTPGNGSRSGTNPGGGQCISRKGPSQMPGQTKRGIAG